MDGNPNIQQQSIALLSWYLAMGVDDVSLTTPLDRKKAPAPTEVQNRSAVIPQAQVPVTQSSPSTQSPPVRPMAIASSDLESLARSRAADAQTLAELETTLKNFDGLSLPKTATNLVFADGNPLAPIMLIGEAPGAEEDRSGKPFVGPSGQLLDKMLASIGLSRQHNLYITNVLFWRPPGNRKPTETEVSMCLPFVLRHIELIQPKLILLCGGTAVSAMTSSNLGITKIHGQWQKLPIKALEIPALPIYHPAYILRQPALKREIWFDLLQFRKKVAELNLLPPQ